MCPENGIQDRPDSAAPAISNIIPSAIMGTPGKAVSTWNLVAPASAPMSLKLWFLHLSAHAIHNLYPDQSNAGQDYEHTHNDCQIYLYHFFAPLCQKYIGATDIMFCLLLLQSSSIICMVFEI